MDPQAPNFPPVPPERPVVLKSSQSAKDDNHWISILAMAIFVLFALGVIVFLYSQNQQLKNIIISLQTPLPSTPVPSAVPVTPIEPVVSSPSAGIKIKSPLVVNGTVPAGWMFEGVFPIKLVDANQKLIVQGQAKEKVAGNWQTGQPVAFTATLTFKAATGSGTLILENDNPSGDPANSKTFEIPVKFSTAAGSASPNPSQTACTLEAKICPDGSSVGRAGPNCEFAPCP